jgi:16S rRNA (guanine(966)-N(2))-methyltransferase RsmD
MRIIAGKYRSRPLRSLKGVDIRPTSDRLRETLFNVLTAGNPEALEGTVWLDLYAGTGAVGIEALSRGAALVYFVESSVQASQLIAQNLSSLGIQQGFRILKLEVVRGIRSLANDTSMVDFVFLDPPYRMHEAYGQAFDALAQTNLLKPDGVVVAEHEKRFDPGDVCGGFHRYRELIQGDAGLSFYRTSAAYNSHE